MQAMQLSNGLANPVGLWLGHLMFDSLFTIFIATVNIIIFTAVTNKFNGPGFLVRAFPLLSGETEFRISYTVVGHDPLRDYGYIVGILRLFIHVLTSGFLRCRCGFSSRHVPGMCAIRWQLVHAHTNTDRYT